ncbi:unnamed protein product [Caenorhabditis brenneri]
MSDSKQLIDQIKTLVLDISAFFAISINFLLIVLIITKSPKSIGTYKHLMIYIAFFELGYAILYVAEKPSFLTRNNSSSYLLESFKNWKLLLWLLFPILNAAIWSYAAAVIFAATEDSDRFLKEFYLPNKKNGTQVGDIYYGGPFYYMTDRHGKFYVNWRAFEGTAIVLTLIDLFTKGSAFFLIVNWKESIFPKYIACLLDLLFVGFFGISIAILALHFIYRFLSITNNRHLKSFNSWKIVLWFMIPLLNGVLFMITGGIILCADQETDRFMKENYPELLENKTQIDDYYYVGPFFWPKLSNSDYEQYFSWKGARGSVIVMGLIVSFPSQLEEIKVGIFSLSPVL